MSRRRILVRATWTDLAGHHEHWWCKGYTLPHERDVNIRDRVRVFVSTDGEYLDMMIVETFWPGGWVAKSDPT